jgi:hypothetical protein
VAEGKAFNITWLAKPVIQLILYYHTLVYARLRNGIFPERLGVKNGRWDTAIILRNTFQADQNRWA